MNRFIFISIWIVILLAIGLISLGTFWLTWPYKIAVQNGPSKILSPVVKLGGDVFYELDYCKYMDITPIDTKRQLIDGLVYPLPTAPIRVLPTGCRKVIASATVIIPECAECFDHDVHLEILTTYQVNPLRTMTVRFVTEKFRVTK